MLVSRLGCRSQFLFRSVPWFLDRRKGDAPLEASPWWLRSIGGKPTHAVQAGFRLVCCRAHFPIGLGRWCYVWSQCSFWIVEVDHRGCTG